MAELFKRSKIAKIVNNIFSTLINDDDLGRLLLYDSSTPFAESILTVAQKKSLINTKLFKTTNNRNLENRSGSFVSLRPNEIKPSPNNSNAIEYQVDFYVICHSGSVSTVDGDRDYLILESILRMFHLKDTVGIGKSKLISARDLAFNSNDFSGYVITIGFVYDVMV